MKRSWVEVNLKNLENNYIFYKKNVENLLVMPVVKADAYGHGAVAVSKYLQDVGVCDFAVSNISEAIQLRNEGIEGQIVVLGYTPVEEIDNLLKYDITQAIISEEYMNALIKKKCKVKCHVALDTGMNRIGFDADNPKLCEKKIRKCYEKLEVTGIFTHLCVADSYMENDCKFTVSQIEKFMYICHLVKDLSIKYIHCANSAAGLWHNHGGNLVRLGIVLYGLKPDRSNVLPQGILPVLEWKSVVAMVKEISKEKSIGYGRTYIATRQMKIATIPTGYADGYSRFMSNRGYVLIKGYKAPIVGRICMDQFMVDVSDIPDVKMGDEVVLLGRSGNQAITADDMAEIIGTIGYEVVCNISKRVPRVYI